RKPALAGRTAGTQRHRTAVVTHATAADTGLHGAGEPRTDRVAPDIDELTRYGLLDRRLGADVDQCGRRPPKLDQLALRLDLRLGVMPAHRLGDVLHLGLADAELDGGVAVLLGRAHRHDLHVVNLQHGDRHVLTRLGEETRHA